MNKRYTDPRLEAVLGQPERIVQVDQKKLPKGLVVKFGPKQQERLQLELAGQTLAKLLHQAREDSDKTVREVAQLMGKHPSRVSAIEKGSGDLAFRTFVEYAHSLGYTVEVKLVPQGSGREALGATLEQSSR